LYAVWERVCRIVDDEVLPVVNDYWERAEFPRPLTERLRLNAADVEGVGTSVTVGSPAGRKAAAASRMAVLEGMGRLLIPQRAPPGR
jgi:glutaryl-CoA dehydrogenase